MDLFRMLFLSVTFGVLVTAHIALLASLAARKPRWHALVGLLIPPLAPFWGWQEHRRFASSCWLLGLFGYALALIAARF